MILSVNNQKHVLLNEAFAITNGSNIIVYPQGFHDKNVRVIIDVKDSGAAILLCQLLSESIADGEDVNISVSATSFKEIDCAYDT